jgi:hypothetical protein
MLKLSVTPALANLSPAGTVEPTKHVPNLGHVVIVGGDTVLVAYASLPIFRDESGDPTRAQLLAFEDTWHEPITTH